MQTRLIAYDYQNQNVRIFFLSPDSFRLLLEEVLLCVVQGIDIKTSCCEMIIKSSFTCAGYQEPKVCGKNSLCVINFTIVSGLETNKPRRPRELKATPQVVTIRSKFKLSSFKLRDTGYCYKLVCVKAATTLTSI